LATEKELSDFLKGADRRAFKRTVYAVHDDEAALDIVQDSMIRLAEKYADRPVAELPLLFARILSNATMDWFRRRKVRVAVLQNFSDLEPAGSSPDFDLLDTLEAVESAWGARGPADNLSRQQTLEAIDAAVAELAPRQREAFLLRYWEELDVAETATVMGCSVGSVKTHCARAVKTLATALTSKGLKP
jgi:RNA polymerase sigma-70 factor, ECF subfamily